MGKYGLISMKLTNGHYFRKPLLAIIRRRPYRTAPKDPEAAKLWRTQLRKIFQDLETFEAENGDAFKQNEVMLRFGGTTWIPTEGVTSFNEELPEVIELENRARAAIL